MSNKSICPWWFGYLLLNPLRRFIHDPAQIIAPYVKEGMTVMEPGPGMGYFTLELAKKVGSTGRVIAVDIQPKMLEGLKRRAAKAQLLERIDARSARPDSMCLTELAGTVDFVLAFAVVHELPNANSFFLEISQALKPDACLLLAEPNGHVTADHFEAELRAAAQAGLDVIDRPSIRRSQTALLKKT